jgi:CIC family chloride channel protein
VGLVAAVVPEVMGVGYDTVSAALTGSIGAGLLLTIAVAKLLSTCVCAGAGLPAGIIGPSILIGATSGGALGLLGAQMLPDGADLGLYAMLGLAGMMSATLQAPLAALMALLELTANPNIIFPGMLVVVLSSLVSSELFGQKGYFPALLGVAGVELKSSALSRFLDRAAVPAVMERSVRSVARYLSWEDAQQTIASHPVWLVIESDQSVPVLLPAAALAHHLERMQSDQQPLAQMEDELDLLSLPLERVKPVPVLLSATLKEVLQAMDKAQTSVASVHRVSHAGESRLYGVVTRAQVEGFYTVPQG